VTASVWLGVMVGGALGALARMLVSGGASALVARWGGAGGAVFPWPTLAVNVAGSFALALLVTLAARGVVSPEARVWLGTGFLGAFTTFSTFSLEADELARRGLVGLSVLYVVLSVTLGALAVLAGRALGTRP
jgi:CrcB protein